MPRIVVTAQVEDSVKWEEGFRTHGDLFRNNYGVTAPVSFAINEGNAIAVCFEPADLKKALEAINSPATVEAMTADGVKRDTVKVFVLDKELKV